MKTPVIYDTIEGPHGEQKVVNPDATLAAREKQKLIKEKFKSWVFAVAVAMSRLSREVRKETNSRPPEATSGFISKRSGKVSPVL
jgi:N12 class adenine-specific DNA methylase